MIGISTSDQFWLVKVKKQASRSCETTGAVSTKKKPDYRSGKLGGQIEPKLELSGMRRAMYLETRTR